MNIRDLPLLLEPDALEALLGSPEDHSEILVVDLCKPTTYATTHIPGAVHLNYPQIVAVNNPVMGLIPDTETLSRLFSSMGLTKDKHVIAYDDEEPCAITTLPSTPRSVAPPTSS